MNAAPSICRGCGATIKEPDGSHLCGLCKIDMHDERTDNNDLTHKLWRLRYRSFWKGVFVGFSDVVLTLWIPTAVICLFVYWLVKQLL